MHRDIHRTYSCRPMSNAKRKTSVLETVEGVGEDRWMDGWMDGSRPLTSIRTHRRLFYPGPKHEINIQRGHGDWQSTMTMEKKEEEKKGVGGLESCNPFPSPISRLTSQLVHRWFLGLIDCS